MDSVALVLRVVLSLGVVLFLVWGSYRTLARRQQPKAGADTVTVVARQGIGVKASVAVIDTCGQRLVLGVTEQSVNVLHTTPTVTAGTTPGPASSLEVVTTANFDQALAVATAAATAPAPVNTVPKGHGSILAPSTWRQAAEAVRRGPVR